jgi:hypothetical protein
VAGPETAASLTSRSAVFAAGFSGAVVTPDATALAAGFAASTVGTGRSAADQAGETCGIAGSNLARPDSTGATAAAGVTTGGLTAPSGCFAAVGATTGAVAAARLFAGGSATGGSTLIGPARSAAADGTQVLGRSQLCGSIVRSANSESGAAAAPIPRVSSRREKIRSANCSDRPVN